jgi:hypothetical protein
MERIFCMRRLEAEGIFGGEWIVEVVRYVACKLQEKSI